MARILDIQKKSNAYIANLNDNIVRVIEAGAENEVVYNRVQMLGNTNSEDMPLIHKSTLSEYLTPAYAKKTGKSKPDLWLTGGFQKDMFFFMPSMKEYFISSKNYLSGFLAKNYRRIFGISPVNQPKIQLVNDKAVIEDYLKIFQ